MVGSFSENIIEYCFRFFWAEFKWLLCHIDGEDCHFVESIFPKVTLALMTLSDMHDMT